MTPKTLRYILVGLGASLPYIARCDTIYMFSRPDGTVYFNGAPSTPRFAAYSNSAHRDRRLVRRPPAVAPININNILSAKSQYEPLVDEIARGYQIDSALLHAVISVESRYNPNATSPAGAVGLMQLMPATAKRYGAANALDPEQNLRAGAKYLRDLLAIFDSDVRLALAAYHAGEYAVARHNNSIPPFQSTIEFVGRVLALYNKYRANTTH